MKSILLVALALLTLGLRAQNNPTNNPPDQVIPLIVMDQVPLKDAIKNLARQAHINYIIDPRVAAASENDTAISKRWEKVTAQQALNDVLAGSRLKLATNQATTVSRIVSSNDTVKPTEPIQSSNEAKAAMPVIVMDDVPLDAAILNLAR